MEITKSDAIKALHPNVGFSFINGQINIWESDQPQPTEEQIQAKLAELQAEYEATQYQRDRAVAYPSYADQLDTIYHQGLDAWKAEIKKVKDQFPKPE